MIDMMAQMHEKEAVLILERDELLKCNEELAMEIFMKSDEYKNTKNRIDYRTLRNSGLRNEQIEMSLKATLMSKNS